MKYVIANLKMNLVTAKECDRYLDLLNRAWKKCTQKSASKLIVCPSPFYTERFARKLPARMFLGSQNIFWESQGSFTGEVSPLSLKDAGVYAVLCGHSERRAYLGETNEQVSRKIKGIIDNGMTAVVCVGETEEEREHDDTVAVIVDQTVSAMSAVSSNHLGQVIIAYEPRWAIGTGVTPASEDIAQVRIIVRKVLTKKYGAKVAEKVSIVYGGSVKASLMKEVCIDAGMDGVLVGRESLDPVELMKIFDTLSE